MDNHKGKSKEWVHQPSDSTEEWFVQQLEYEPKQSKVMHDIQMHTHTRANALYYAQLTLLARNGPSPHHIAAPVAPRTCITNAFSQTTDLRRVWYELRAFLARNA